MIESHALQRNITSDAYTDLASLNSIRALAKTDKNAALEKVAKQFESMLVRMMMKSMRDANAVFMKGNMLSSPATNMYQQMYDDQLAVSLSEGPGMGLGELMVKQLQSRFGVEKGSDSDSGNSLERTQLSPITVRAVEQESIEQASEPVFDGSVSGFVNQLYDYAHTAAEKMNVSVKTLLAQAGLETGWGKKMLQGSSGESSNNLFNIKAGKDWQGDSVKVLTLEFENNLPVKKQASFRAYQSLQASFDDYIDFVTGRGRYDKALQAKDDEAYIRELADAGYATDPEYANKIIRIANSDALEQALAMVEVKQ